MQEMLGDHLLFRGPLVTIADRSCRTHDAECQVDGPADRHRLVFTRTGAALAQRVDVRSCDVVSDPVQAVLLDAGARYRLRHPAAGRHAYTVFAFAPAALRADDRPAIAGRHVIHADILLRYHRLRQTLLGRAEWNDRSALAVEEEAIALLHGATSSKPDPAPARARRHRGLAESAKMVLASAPGSAHRVGDVAASFNVSPSHLAHVFRAEVGIPMHRYLLQVRMAIALDRLGAGATNLSELALDLGFVSHSHFTAAFRQYFGVPPRLARRTLALRA